MDQPTCDYNGESLTGGYFRHRRNGEPACSTCLAKFAAWSRDRKQRKGRSDKVHHITCAYCGTAAEVSKPTVKCCSQSCAARLLAGWSTSTALVHVGRAQRRPRPEPVPVMNTEWWRIIVVGPCAHCGETFTRVAASACSAPAYCDRRCARGAERLRRRTVKRNNFVAKVSRRRIYERDRWTCQLCGKRVARTKTVPHPNAPVLDHIVPLAKGGTHEPRNVQCAHFLCNSLKGDGGTDQLRLIG